MFRRGLNVRRTGSVEIRRGAGSRRRTGPCGLPEGGVRAPRPAPRGDDQPVPQWDVLPPVPPPAPEPGPSLRPRGSHLHGQIHSGAVPERKGTASPNIQWILLPEEYSRKPQEELPEVTTCVFSLQNKNQNIHSGMSGYRNWVCV